MPGTKLFSRSNYQVLRGFSELLGDATLCKAEWRIVRAFFGDRCAFCDIPDTGNSRTGIIPDHLVAAKELGVLCLGNAVPACHDCNDRRGKRDWREYLRRYHPQDAKDREAKIDEYLQAYPYSPPIDPHESLTADEKQEYLNLLSEWDTLWKRAQALRDKIKARRAPKRTKPNHALQRTGSAVTAPASDPPPSPTPPRRSRASSAGR